MKERNLYKKIDVPTTNELKEIYYDIQRKYDFSLYLLYFGNSNMMSFLSGIIATIPISLLIGLVTVKITTTTTGTMFAIIMFVQLIITSFLTSLSLSLTLSIIEIGEKCNNFNDKDIQWKESRINKKFELCYEKLKITYHRTIWVFILAFVSIIGFFSMFVLINISIFY